MSSRYNLTKEQQTKQLELANKLNTEGLSPEDVECECEEHPEGSKRGGYVPVHYDGETRVFWQQTAEDWAPYDSCHDVT